MFLRGQLKQTVFMSRRTVSSGAEATFPALLREADKICFISVKNFRDESNLQDLLQYSLQKRMWELASTLCLLTVPSNSGNSSWDSAFEHDSKGWWEDPGPVTKPLAGLNWWCLLQQGHGLTQTEVLQLAREASPGQRLQHICLQPRDEPPQALAHTRSREL